MTQETVIRLENLSKTFGRGPGQVQAVKSLNLSISGRQVYGFLGPNGAGKSTTIRMIVNLIYPTDGGVYLFGQNPRKQPAILERVGALVETPGFYPFLSGRENLAVWARTGCDTILPSVFDRRAPGGHR